MPEKKELTSTGPEPSTPKPVTNSLPQQNNPTSPINNQQPTTNNAKPKLRSPKYEYAGAEKTKQSLGQAIPKQLIPTSRFATIVGLIFLAVIILALAQFPFNKLLAGDTSITIGIGYPWPFLELGLADPEAQPLRIANLFLDLMLYIILAYAIDIIINLILNNKLTKSEEGEKTQPSVYKNIKPTLADKIVKKAFESEKK